MKKFSSRLLALLLAVMMIACATAGYAEAAAEAPAEDAAVSYTYDEYPLERNGIALHLDRIAVEGGDAAKSILLVHGLTYSSHEFDMDYEDYSLVRFLARQGYAVWRVDVAGYGQSGDVEDGFMPDSDYAAEDINAAVELICSETGLDKIDVLGWSWGTVTSSRFVANHPEHVNKLVLYAPILGGLGAADITDAFHHNDWAHAADDFQKLDDGSFDLSVAEHVIIEMYCSSCWHYDGEYSPNGGRRDLCVDASERLIDLSAIPMPTLVICGDKDPYMNYDMVNSCLDSLPEGSVLEIIPGASHVAMIEKPFYHDFQTRLMNYLNS